MMKKRLSSFLLSLILLGGCTFSTEAAFLKEVPLNNSTQQIQVSDAIRSAVFAMTEELTADYFSSSPKTNQIFSPLSLWYALGVLREGAAGETLAEIARLMKLDPGFNSASIIPDLSKTLNFMKPSMVAKDGSKSGLRLTNGIFFEKKYRNNLKTSYLDKAAAVWGTESAAVDFTKKAETKEIIRGWVSQKTDGFIPDYEATFPDDGSAILNLYNVLHLKDRWLTPFADLGNQPFNTRKGPVLVPYLGCREVAEKYSETPNYQAAAFPGETGIRVWFILPAQGSDPLDLIPDLAAILSGGQAETVDFKAPSLTIDGGNLSLKQLLIDKGYPLMFSAADFSQMLSGTKASVGDIKQKTKLQMDRFGFEAAAVTEVSLTKSGIPGPVFSMNLDRPYLLVFEYQDLPLFIAQINDPAEP